MHALKEGVTVFEDDDFFFHQEGCCRSTFPTRCRKCGRIVYYHSCTCGSKVYFDALGEDWPKHDCSDQSRSTRGRKFKLSTDGPLIPSDQVEVYAVTGQVDTLKGVIWEVVHDRDQFTYFRVERGLMSSLALGELANYQLGQISLRVQRGEQPAFYALWIPSSLLLKYRLKNGVPVFAKIRAVDIQDRDCVWFCYNILSR